MSGKLNHFDQHGNAVMVDVTDKNVTEREAVATGKYLYVMKHMKEF